MIDIKGNIVIEPLFADCSNVEGDVVELKDTTLRNTFYGDYSKKSYSFNIKNKQKAFLNDNAK